MTPADINRIRREAAHVVEELCDEIDRLNDIIRDRDDDIEKQAETIKELGKQIDQLTDEDA